MSSPTTTTLSFTLRKTCIASFPLSFIILLIHGILTESPFPATGLIPLFASAAYSLICVQRTKPDGSYAAHADGHPLIDLIVAMGILPLLIVSWVFDMGNKWGRWYSQPALVVLGTYGSVGLLYNCAVHAFFVLKYVYGVVRDVQNHKACPHCTHCMHGTSTAREVVAGEYEAVAQDEEGRVSLDETVVDGGKDIV